MRRDEAGNPSTFRLQEPDVVIEAFPDETIAVHLGTGRYYSIDLAGADVLELVASGWDEEAIAARLVAHYDADPSEVAVAVTGFVDRLLDEGLIAPAPGRRPEGDPSAPVRGSGSFAAPDLAVYSDMEDLLLLDPIHDVDETGWPVRAEVVEPHPTGPPDGG